MNYDFKDVEKNIVKYKYNFCCDFEKEMDFDVSEYSQGIFDYLFNLFKFKKPLGELVFKKNLDEFKGMNFKNPSELNDYIKNKYPQLIMANKQYFMDYFGFKHEDPLYMSRKIDANKDQFRQKLMEFY